MKYVNLVVVIVFLVVLVAVVANDLAHPEVWDSDWQRDPRIYGWMAILLIPLGGLLVRECIRHKRLMRESVTRTRQTDKRS
jgi:hypothetical protein